MQNGSPRTTRTTLSCYLHICRLGEDFMGNPFASLSPTLVCRGSSGCHIVVPSLYVLFVPPFVLTFSNPRPFPRAGGYPWGNNQGWGTSSWKRSLFASSPEKLLPLSTGKKRRKSGRIQPRRGPRGKRPAAATEGVPLLHPRGRRSGGRRRRRPKGALGCRKFSGLSLGASTLRLAWPSATPISER